jgi:hypothetical protein
MIPLLSKYFKTTTNDLNLFFLLTGDPGRQMFDPDWLGEMVKIEQGSNLLNQIFNLIARYVRNPGAVALSMTEKKDKKLSTHNQ